MLWRYNLKLRNQYLTWKQTAFIWKWTSKKKWTKLSSVACCSSQKQTNKLPSKSSSGSDGFSVKRVSNLYKVAKTSRFSADRENTGKHCDRTSPHIRITTNNSRILFSATRSLLISYWSRSTRTPFKMSLANNMLCNKLQIHWNTYTTTAIHSTHASTIWKLG